MKLTKEDVYIDLRGKSKEELTELWVFLEIVGEKKYLSLNRLLNEPKEWKFFIFGRYDQWILSISKGNRTEVTIEQLKEILKPMENKEEQLIKEAKERGFLTEGNEFYSCFSDNNELRIIEPYNSKLEINLYLDKGGCLRYYDGLNNEYDNSLCSNPAIYKDGVWAEIVSGTLEQQLQKAEAEVKRLKEEINKPKVGDWAMLWEDDEETPVFGLITDVTDFYLTCNGSWEYAKKITNKQLIESLENESRIIKG